MQDISLETLGSINRCQIHEMEMAGQHLDPAVEGSCKEFGHKVRNVQAAIIHTYQVVAHLAIQQADAAGAAVLWREMNELCDAALVALRDLKGKYPYCGTPELYDLALDYKITADKNYRQNLEDAECATLTPPNGLFPKMS
jgi:hypothetical protein